jgi:hypothetical protein
MNILETPQLNNEFLSARAPRNLITYPNALKTQDFLRINDGGFPAFRAQSDGDRSNQKQSNR